MSIVNWNYPTSVTAGPGAIAQLGEVCQAESINSPLVVTDKGVSELGFFKALFSDLSSRFEMVSIFSDVDANPSSQNVEAGVLKFIENGHDGVIALGGGSALDTAKAIALMSGQKLPIWDFEDVGDNWKNVIESGVAPVIAIPTTAGTGSEVGRASVITDTERKVKKIIFHPLMLPVKVILDPKLTIDLPPKLTAATGLDALSHCLEAYCSPFFHPMAEGIAVEGVRLIRENLVTACQDGSDVDARMNMLVASSMGATAFQKGLGAMHAIAHSVGALYGAHHGLLNAILMPYVLIENRREIESKISRLAQFIGLENTSFDGFIDWIRDLRLVLEIPNTLGQIIGDNADIDKLAKMSVNDPSAGGNPILFTEEEYAQLIRSAMSGS